MPISDRSRLAVVAGVSLLVVVLVGGGILLAGRLGPSPTPSASSPTTPASVAPSPSTPDGAARAFFDAVTTARRVGDQAVVEPFVTSTTSSAYQTVAGFVEGQRAAGKASVTTEFRVENVAIDEQDDTATLTATLYEAGYDIDLESGEPLESPVTLPLRTLVVELRRVGSVWRVDAFETRPLTPGSS